MYLIKKRRFILDDSFFHFCSRALYLSKRYQSRIIWNTSVALMSLNILHDHRHACRQKWTLWNFYPEENIAKTQNTIRKEMTCTWHTEIISQNVWSVILVFSYEMPLTMIVSSHCISLGAVSNVMWINNHSQVFLLS